MKAAILKITPPYAKKFAPPDLPPPISELYNPECLSMDYLTLIEECEKIFNTIKV